eukprot:gene30703-40825_t
MLLFQDILRWMDDTPYSRLDLGAGTYRFKRELGNVQIGVTHGFIGAPSAAALLRETAYALRKAASASRAEDGAADADMRRPELDRGLVIGAHAHRQAAQAVAGRDLRQQREMRRGRILGRRNAHQPLDGEAVHAAAAFDEGLLLAGGGHAMAAGLTIRPSAIPDLRAFLCERLAGEMLEAAGLDAIEIDALVSPGGATRALYTEFQRLAPFGPGNPEPTFAVADARIERPMMLKGGMDAVGSSRKRNGAGCVCRLRDDEKPAQVAGVKILAVEDDPVARAVLRKALQKLGHDAELNRRAEDKGTTTVRVQAERLDELMDRVGELVIAQSRLSQLAGASSDIPLRAVSEDIERLSGELRDTMMVLRMVPVTQLFGRFRRLVHDLAHETHKTIELITEGESTEVDKTVIERLADPLVHLVRNSCDHGLETPEERIAAGKPAMGRVVLSARQTGGEVTIMIRDDGRGINRERVRAKAESSGIIAPNAVLSDQELLQLIFQPGFSTAQSVTNLSGRGVGMDVVKRTIDALR